MKCDELKEQYLKSLGYKIKVKQAEDGCIINTSHVNPSNEHIELLVEEINDNYKISDMARSAEYLFMHGVDVKPDSRSKWYLDYNVNRLKTCLSKDELYIEVPKNDLANGIVRMIDAINSINSIVYTVRIRGAYDFREDVAEWLSESNITFTPNVSYHGITKPVTINFVIERAAKTPIFMDALHSENIGYAKGLANNTIIDFWDLKDAKIDFYSVCLLDDTVEEDVWKNQVPVLNHRIDRVEYWRERSNLLPLLA